MKLYNKETGAELFEAWRCSECGGIFDRPHGIPCGEDDYISSCPDCGCVECIKSVLVDDAENVTPDELVVERSELLPWPTLIQGGKE